LIPIPKKKEYRIRKIPTKAVEFILAIPEFSLRFEIERDVEQLSRVRREEIDETFDWKFMHMVKKKTEALSNEWALWSYKNKRPIKAINHIHSIPNVEEAFVKSSNRRDARMLFQKSIPAHAYRLSIRFYSIEDAEMFVEAWRKKKV